MEWIVSLDADRKALYEGNSHARVFVAALMGATYEQLSTTLSGIKPVTIRDRSGWAEKPGRLNDLWMSNSQTWYRQCFQESRESDAALEKIGDICQLRLRAANLRGSHFAQGRLEAMLNQLNVSPEMLPEGKGLWNKAMKLSRVIPFMYDGGGGGPVALLSFTVWLGTVKAVLDKLIDEATPLAKASSDGRVLVSSLMGGLYAHMGRHIEAIPENRLEGSLKTMRIAAIKGYLDVSRAHLEACAKTEGASPNFARVVTRCGELLKILEKK